MRNYIVASWSDADQYDYSGEMLGGSRHQGRSQRVHFNPDGSACVASYSDPEVKSKISIKDQILPQGKRLTTLRNQMLALENSYRAGEMSISDYSLLRDLVVAKIQRQEVLLKRATSVKPINKDEDDIDLYEETPEVEQAFYATNHASRTAHTSVASNCGVRFIDELSSENSLKNILIKACKVIRTVRYCSQQAAAYYRTLKEV